MMSTQPQVQFLTLIAQKHADVKDKALNQANERPEQNEKDEQEEERDQKR